MGLLLAAGTVDAEIKLSSVENPVLTDILPLKPEVGVHSHTCFAYCQKCFPCPNFYLPGPFTFIFAKIFLSVLVLAIQNVTLLIVTSDFSRFL